MLKFKLGCYNRPWQPISLFPNGVAKSKLAPVLAKYHKRVVLRYSEQMLREKSAGGGQSGSAG